MNCEDVRMAAMAMADGEPAHLPETAVREHAAGCGACREAIAGMLALQEALDRLERPRRAADLWPAVESRLSGGKDRLALILLAAALAVYKIIEFAPSRDFGMFVQLAPVAIAASVLMLLKQNPFKINAGLYRQ